MAVIDVTEQTFQTEVLERSREVPVVVDFWAAWCGPCRQLSPILERLADEADGGWILAKIDVDSNQALSQAFGVQGIPAVHAFKDGKPVANFVGALPEAQVREWLTQLGPSIGDRLVEQAQQAEAAGDTEAAIAAYREALNHEPARLDAKAGVARLEAAARAADADEPGLRARVEADPADVEAASGLADILFARGDVEQGSRVLIECVRRTSGDEREAARAHLVALLDALAPDDGRALEARKALAGALF